MTFDDGHETPSPNFTAATVAVVVDSFEAELERGTDYETAIGSIPLPTDQLTDLYLDRDDASKNFEAMVRAMIYARVTGRSDYKMQRDLSRWEDLRHLLGFECDYVSRGVFSRTRRKRFDEDTRQFIRDVSEGILQSAHEHGVNPAFLAEYRDTIGGSVDEALLKKYAVSRARTVVFESWTTDRADNRSYSDMDHIRQAAYMAMTDSGTPSGSRRHEQANGDAMSGNNHLKITKRYHLPRIEQSFQSSVRAVYDIVRRQWAFTEPAVTAIDVTPYPYWGEPDANPMMARMTSGMRPEKTPPRALKFATITTAGDTIPLILAVNSVQEESPWGGSTYHTDTLVGELVDQASEYVRIRLLLMDREFDATTVAKAVTDRDVTFLTPLRKRRNRQGYHIEMMRREGIHVDVEPWELDVYEKDEHVETLLFQHLYVPSTTETQRTQVFRTNDRWVAEDTAEGFANRYQTRWDIENQYKTIKNEFLPSTSSQDWTVRAFYFYLGCALQNAWRLADFYFQDAHDDLEYDGSPELTAGEFVDLAAKELDDLL